MSKSTVLYIVKKQEGTSELGKNKPVKIAVAEKRGILPVVKKACFKSKVLEYSAIARKIVSLSKYLQTAL